MLPYEKIVLYGLSADPPHRGHLAILQGLAQDFDQVWTWAVDNPLKTEQATPLAHRQHMVALTVAATKSHRILHRPEFTSPWTAESVALIHFLYPGYGLWVALGSDALREIEHWENLPLLFARIQGITEVVRADAATGWQLVRETPIQTLKYPIPPWASREIRSQFHKQQPPEGLLPEVHRYIIQSNLYP